MIRVRIAPSPTGFMHVGTARTALFNWLFAKKNRGVFILRIEDTDRERSKEEYEKNILEGLEWLGLDYQEGPIRQSERGDIYQKYIKQLLESGKAFYCYHAKEELEKEREIQTKGKKAPRHICDQKSNVPQGDNGASGVIRLRNSSGAISFDDKIRGKIEFDAALLGDFSIARIDQSALYNFAAAVDDVEMKISHVIRGEDHISNTPKQILIQQALGFKSPIYAHLPLILGEDKSKLSKRHGATALFAYKEMGYLPEAMFNFLAFLGWNPGDDKEILSRFAIAKKFSLDDIQKSGAIFNIDKLDWFNGEYIRAMSLSELVESVQEYFPQDTDLDIKKIVALEQSRMARFSDIREATEFFFKDTLDYDAQLLKWKDMNDEELTEILRKLEQLLESIPEKNYTKEKLEEIIMPKSEEWSLDLARDKGVAEKDRKIDRGKVLWPLRVALSGRKASPGPFEIMEILGKEKCLARLREAMVNLPS